MFECFKVITGRDTSTWSLRKRARVYQGCWCGYLLHLLPAQTWHPQWHDNKERHLHLYKTCTDGRWKWYHSCNFHGSWRDVLIQHNLSHNEIKSSIKCAKKQDSKGPHIKRMTTSIHTCMQSLKHKPRCCVKVGLEPKDGTDQTYGSTSGLIFVMKNIMHILQTCVVQRGQR